MQLIIVLQLLLCHAINILALGSSLIEELFIKELESNNEDAQIDVESVNAAMLLAQQHMRYTNVHDHSLFSLGVFLEKDAAGFDRFNVPKNPDSMSNAVYVSEIITRGLGYLADENCGRYNVTREEYIQMILRKGFRLLGICEVTSEPDVGLLKDPLINKYRTIDGSYNNLRNPTHGKTNNIFPRFLPPAYGNYLDSPRRSKSGKRLKSSRTISVKIFTAISKPDVDLSNLAMEMTQIVSHDMSLQNMDNNLETGPVSCCTNDQKCVLPKIYQHKSCQPIGIEKSEEKFYQKYGIGCLNFVRSCPAPRPDCILGVRQQINTVTGYLDLSIVYGSNNQTASSLRTFKNGMLKESPTKHLPPCSTNNESFCYVAGDVRINQQPFLATVQTILLREHNRISANLKIQNPTWDDERLYQESRRILIAIYQQINYFELFPALLGPNFTSEVFKIDSKGYSSCYNPSLNGATHNDFSIAYRILHSLIPSDMKLCDAAWKIIKSFRFSEMVGNMTVLEAFPDGLDSVIRGMTATSSERSDPFVTAEITNFMFVGGKGYGTDLMAFDIERSRDHGIPGYNKYREFCGLKRARTFEDFSDAMPKEVINVLRGLYEDPDDVDLVVAGLLEIPVANSKFGPVMHCIFKEQWYRSACGDRFFFMNSKQAYPFTPAQLAEIKKATISSLFCLNGDNIKSMSRNGFLIPSTRNPILKCSDFKSIDFKVFKMA